MISVMLVRGAEPMEKRVPRAFFPQSPTGFPAGYPPILLITFCPAGRTARRSRTTERSESVSEEAE